MENKLRDAIKVALKEKSTNATNKTIAIYKFGPEKC